MSEQQNPAVEAEPRDQPRISLSSRILIGLGAGILLGLFLGELAAPLQIVGKVFIGLLQMSVLPYVAISLIAALGSLSYRRASALAAHCGVLLLVLWAVGVLMVFATPIGFPDWQTAAFFSPSLLTQTAEFDFVSLYVPKNPFKAMVDSVVPAVVVFSIALGIAVIGVKDKERLIDVLQVLAEALSRIARFMVRLAPIGVFAIAASAAGTMSIEEFGRLQVYILVFGSVALAAGLWVIPGLIAALTPLRYRDVLGPTRDALVTAFATGNIFVVLPILAERSKTLLEKCGIEEEASGPNVDVIIPVAYNFPTIGALLALSFILFAGWTSGSPIGLSEYPLLGGVGVLSIFGNVLVAMPFLLNLMQVPADTFELFVVVNQVMNSRFGGLVGAMHILFLAVVGTYALEGSLRFNWHRLLRFAIVSAVLVVVPLIAIRAFFTYVVVEEYVAASRFVAMELMSARVPDTRDVLADGPLSAAPDGDRLKTIENRGTLRVGYLADSLPFVFQNAEGVLVGLDVDMAHLLARDLGVSLEFVRLPRERMAEALDAGAIDIAMSGLTITPEELKKVNFSIPYMDLTSAFIVPDHRREDFNDRVALHREALNRSEDLRIAVLDRPYYVLGVREYLPDATLTVIETPQQFFRQAGQEFDALVFNAEAGSAWTLVYPQYSVAIPHPDVYSEPVAFALPRGEREFVEFVSNWIRLIRENLYFQAFYDQWILGRNPTRQQPRWSVVRDVLGWVD